MTNLTEDEAVKLAQFWANLEPFAYRLSPEGRDLIALGKTFLALREKLAASELEREAISELYDEMQAELRMS